MFEIFKVTKVTEVWLMVIYFLKQTLVLVVYDMTIQNEISLIANSLTQTFGMIGCIITENWPLESGLELSLTGTARGAKSGSWKHQ